MTTGKSWRLEWYKHGKYRVMSFSDGHEAKRRYQRYGQARLTEMDHLADGTSKVVEVSIAGDHFDLSYL